MYKTESNTQLTPVELEQLPNGKTRVILRKNIKQETRQDEGITYVVYTADENSFITGEQITVEYVTEHFDELWFYAENGETEGEKYARLVSKYIREKYSQDDVEALINNYLSDREKYKEDFDAFQAYRAECKEKAREDL